MNFVCNNAPCPLQWTNYFRHCRVHSVDTNNKLCQLALAVIETEAQAVSDLTSRIDENFVKACEYMLACDGRIVVTGMGKSGHIGNKIAATFASTGTPAFFMHPGEASHGDLGMITKKDVVIAISNSGETDEILTILPLIKRHGIPLISLTGKKSSTIAQAASVNIDISVAHEACPLGLAPTSSTTATLAMGDALAVALLQSRGFTEEDFALSHPGGQLGRRLLLKIDDLMYNNQRMPIVTSDTSLSDTLVEMTGKGLGITAVVDSQGKLCGIFTDGDLRRTLDHDVNLHTTPVKDAMTTDCKTIFPGLLAVEALQVMETHKITALVVTDDNHYPIGVIHMHSILQAGVI